MTTTYLQRARLACAVALAFGALSQGALAQPSEAQLQTVRAVCAADFRAQCPRISPDSKQALECLQENVEHTSQKCQDAVFATMPVATDAEMVPTPPDRHQTDRRRADMPPPPPPRDEPPQPRRTDAAPPLPLPPPAARAAVEPPSPPRASAADQIAMRNYCHTDYIANCAGIPVGSADALACLRGNVSHLSRACRHAVSATLPDRRTPIVSAPPPRTIPERRAARSAEALAEPPSAPPPPLSERAGRDDDAPPSAPPATHERADYAPPPAPAARDDDAPPPRAARAPRPAPPAARVVESRAIRAHCGRDFAAHCPSLRPGSAASLACLQRHAGRLLPNCRRAVGASLSAVPPRNSRASVAAREELPPPHAQHRRGRRLPAASTAALARACRADYERHCRRVRPGAGREIACLAAHHRSLSRRCQTVMRTTLR